MSKPWLKGLINMYTCTKLPIHNTNVCIEIDVTIENIFAMKHFVWLFYATFLCNEAMKHLCLTYLWKKIMWPIYETFVWPIHETFLCDQSMKHLCVSNLWNICFVTNLWNMFVTNLWNICSWQFQNNICLTSLCLCVIYIILCILV